MDKRKIKKLIGRYYVRKLNLYLGRCRCVRICINVCFSVWGSGLGIIKIGGMLGVEGRRSRLFRGLIKEFRGILWGKLI